MFGGFLRGLRARKSAEPEAFRGFLERQTAFVTRKTVEDYCRVKAGRREMEMFADPDFRAALIHCRWQTFAAAAQDMAALAEAWLRIEAAGREQRLAAAIVALVGTILREADAPAGERATLDAAAEGLGLMLAALQESPPLSADRLLLRAEQPLLATLPIHPDQRIGETVAIRGALRFHIVSTQQEMERQFARSGLCERLMGVG